MNEGILRYLLLGITSITESQIRDFIADTNAKRICFSRIQKHALWKTDKGENMITVPFDKSVGMLLKEQTGIILKKSSKGKYYHKIDGAEEYEKVRQFMVSYADTVFLRDLLDVSVALSLNFEDDGKTHTRIGLLEKKAKYDNSEEDLEQLAVFVDDFIGKTPLYANADLICSVPPTKPGDENLPIRIVRKLTHFNGMDISNCVSWTSKNTSLKNADGADKLQMLEHSGFEISENTDVKGKDVVLVDDLYMSGITMQYVAMKLKAAGARKVYGLCFVKSFSNK